MTEKEFKKGYNKKEDNMVLAILDFAEFAGMIIDIVETDDDEVMLCHVEIDYEKCIVKIK